MSFPVPQNTLQQDLFLLAKSHYRTENRSRSGAQLARVICAYHVVHDVASMSYDATLHWVLKEFVESGLILQNPGEVSKFFIGLVSECGMFDLTQQLQGQPPVAAQRKALVAELLINQLLSKVMTIPVRREGEWMMSFPEPKVDEQLRDFIAKELD